MVRDNRHDSAYLFGAICHARKVGAAIIMPSVNAEAMSEHLKEISTQIALGAHAVVVCDRAGWHQSGGRLRVPHNITLLPFPPYAPELNPMENIWDYLRGNKSANVSGPAVHTQRQFSRIRRRSPDSPLAVGRRPAPPRLSCATSWPARDSRSPLRAMLDGLRADRMRLWPSSAPSLWVSGGARSSLSAADARGFVADDCHNLRNCFRF